MKICYQIALVNIRLNSFIIRLLRAFICQCVFWSSQRLLVRCCQKVFDQGTICLWIIYINTLQDCFGKLGLNLFPLTSRNVKAYLSWCLYFIFFDLLFYFSSVLFLFFCLFRATPMACGSSQARVPIRAVAASLHHGHSNARSLAHWARLKIELVCSWMDTSWVHYHWAMMGMSLLF